MSGYENHIMKILRSEGYDFEMEKSFDDLKGGRYRFDFYLNSQNLAIELDGQQHFYVVRGTKSDLLAQQERDRRKNSYCLARGIKLYRIPYWEILSINSAAEIFNDKFLVKDKWYNDNLWREYKKKENK